MSLPLANVEAFEGVSSTLSTLQKMKSAKEYVRCVIQAAQLISFSKGSLHHDTRAYDGGYISDQSISYLQSTDSQVTHKG
jgi:hypothetical protein